MDTRRVFVMLTFFAVWLLCAPSSNDAFAHCDTLDGPVVQSARMAIEEGDVTPVLRWVQADDEDQIRDVFEKTLAVRAQGPQARELADAYFFETLVRVHRAGEGAPYTGLKPGDAVDPAVALADKALESGSVEELVEVLTNAMAAGIRERFRRALEAQQHADESVGAGRAFVNTYVIFTHYVEGMHTFVEGNSAEHGAGATEGHSNNPR